MSRRRFGRNQKRKLREEVKQHKIEAKMNKELAGFYKKSRDSAEAQLDRIISVIEQICPNSVCLPARTIEVDNAGQTEYFQLAMYPKPMYFRAFDDTCESEPIAYTTQRLVEFCIDIEDYRDKLQTLVHVYTKDNHCNMHYMISNEALDTVGLPAKEIMRQFTNKWRHDHV